MFFKAGLIVRVIDAYIEFISIEYSFWYKDIWFFASFSNRFRLTNENNVPNLVLYYQPIA